LCWDSVFNFTFKFFFPSLPHWVFQMIFLWQEYALGCRSCLCSFKLIFGWWGLFVLKMGLVDSIHSKDGWQKLKCRSAIVSGWHVVSMYEVGYSWVLTLVVFTAFLDQDLWPQFFLRWFKFGSTSHCSFIQSGFWSVFSSALFEQLDWTSWDFEHVYAAVVEHPMLDQVSSVVLVLLHKYFYCSMVQKELVLQVGSLAWTPFWEQEKH
jgi:hypothetical protein